MMTQKHHNDKKSSKKMQLRFVTLFPRIENFHFSKDVAMIPYAMQKYYGYSSSIVLYKNQEYKSFNQTTPGLHKLYFPLKKFNSNLNNILFLIKHSRQIDILHLYHIHQISTFICIFVYKLTNKNGIVYIHLDASHIVSKQDYLKTSGGMLKKVLKKAYVESLGFIINKIVLTRNNLQSILFGIQNKSEEKRLRRIFPFRNIVYSPNAYVGPTDVKRPTHKKNTILFAGRLNDIQHKRVDLLVKAFCSISNKIPRYELKLLGQTDKKTQELLMDIINSTNPASRIAFAKPISNRTKLQEAYEQAKICCYPSDSEGFPLAPLEALYGGCLLVTSDIPCYTDITENGHYGLLFQKGNVKDLADKLLAAVNDINKQKYVQENGRNYIEHHFSYPNVLSQVNTWIKEYYDKK